MKNIADARNKKLLSLLTDKIEEEHLLLLASLAKFKFDKSQTALIDKTFQYAKAQDYGTRDLDRYYVTHPTRVARFIADWLDAKSTHACDAVVAALVHNALEKEILSEAELNDSYGTWVRNAIVTITLDREAMKTIEGKNAYYSKLSKASNEVQMLKIFDKLDNLLVLCINPDDATRENYLKEVEEYLLPLARKIDTETSKYIEELISENRRIGFYRPNIESIS